MEIGVMNISEKSIFLKNAVGSTTSIYYTDLQRFFYDFPTHRLNDTVSQENHEKAFSNQHPRSRYDSTACVTIIQIQQNGMTLLEVLISIVILAVGMLGIASMLMFSNKANNSNYGKLQAVQCVYDIFDRIRANSQAAINGNYNVNNIGTNGLPIAVATPSVLCNSAACTSTQMATYDTWYWLTKDVSKLPNGSGAITSALSAATGNTVITVTVQWDDSPAQKQLGASSAASAINANFVQLSIQSEI